MFHFVIALLGRRTEKHSCCMQNQKVTDFQLSFLGTVMGWRRLWQGRGSISPCIKLSLGPGGMFKHALNSCGVMLVVATGDRLMCFNIFLSSHIDKQAWACSRSQL